MAEILLHTDREQQTTSVPNYFIDNYMTNANGEFVKIYLYLLRLLNRGDSHFSVTDLADRFNFTESDIHRGLMYWEKMHLLALEYDGASLCGIRLTEPATAETIREDDAAEVGAAEVTEAAATVASALTVPESAVPEPAVIEEKTYTLQEIASFKSQDEVKELIYVVERYLGKPLSANDLNKIMYWYDGLCFPTDLIEYLIEYCIENGHTSIYYMNKVALNWASDGIRSVAAARQSASIHSQSYYAVMKAFGISGRNLVAKEIAFIEKWTNNYGFTLDIITEACYRTLQETGKATFKYADSILTSWHSHDVHHLEDITPLDQAHAKKQVPRTEAASTHRTANNRFHNFNQRQQDDDYYEALEQKLLRK
jgi:DnaD/phage-associated family protein